MGQLLKHDLKYDFVCCVDSSHSLGGNGLRENFLKLMMNCFFLFLFLGKTHDSEGVLDGRTDVIGTLFLC